MRPGAGDRYGGDHDDPHAGGESLEDVVDRLFDPLTDPLPEPGAEPPGQGRHGRGRHGAPSGHAGGAAPGGHPAGPGPQRSGTRSHRRPPEDGGYRPERGGGPYQPEPDPPPRQGSPWFSPHVPPQDGTGTPAGAGEPLDPLTDPALSYRGPEPSRPTPSHYEPNHYDPAGYAPAGYEPSPEPGPPEPGHHDPAGYEPFSASDRGWFRDERPGQRPAPASHSTDPLAGDPLAGDPLTGDPLTGDADLFGGADPLTAPLVGPDPYPERDSPRSRPFTRPDRAATGPTTRPTPTTGTPEPPDPLGEPRTERFPAVRSPAEVDRRTPPGADRPSRPERDEDGPASSGTDPATRPVRKPAFDDETVALRTTGEHGRPLRADAGGPALGEGRAARRRAQREGGRSSTATEPVGTGRAARRRALKAQKPGPGVIASRVIGELFITCGVLMLLFVTYQLWWTNVLAQRHAAAEADSLQDEWERGGGKDRDAGKFSAGEGFAIMYIPKLDVRVPIAEGISKPNVLDKGMLGHYSGSGLDSAMPWDETGNFAVAGHRNTHGEPFRYINKLVAGDAIVVETKDTFYTYEMANRLPSTSPSNIGVINPIPKDSGFTDPGRYVTLTTCTPEFTSKYRLIVWGKMVDESPRSEGKPDALVD